MSSKIKLESLKIHAFHGVLPEEKILGTYYILNLTIKADIWKAAETDDLKDVAGRMIEKVSKKFPQITSIKIKITKTKPPMQGEMDGVSIVLKKKF